MSKVFNNYTPEQRLNYVMECRKSGLTDCQWCKQNDIPVGTFYGWVKRFRQKGISIPDASGATTVPVKQEIVKVEVIADDVSDHSNIFLSSPSYEKTSVVINDNSEVSSYSPVELSIFGACIKFSDNINPAVLSKTLRLIKELSC